MGALRTTNTLGCLEKKRGVKEGEVSRAGVRGEVRDAARFRGGYGEGRPAGR